MHAYLPGPCKAVRLGADDRLVAEAIAGPEAPKR